MHIQTKTHSNSSSNHFEQRYDIRTLSFLELALVEKCYFFYGFTSLDPRQFVFKTLKTIGGVGLRWVFWIILTRFIVQTLLSSLKSRLYVEIKFFS